MRRTVKRRYQLKHKYIKKIVPKELHEISDSFIDRMGDIISRIDPLEALGFALGAKFGANLGLPLDQILLYGTSGSLAVRGLSSQSEAVGIASIAVLAGFGVSLRYGDGISRYAESQKKVLENFFNDETVSAEERAKRRKDYDTYGWWG